MKRVKPDKPKLTKRNYTPPQPVIAEFSIHLMLHPDNRITAKHFDNDLRTTGKLRLFDSVGHICQDTFTSTLLKMDKAAGAFSAHSIAHEMNQNKAKILKNTVMELTIDQVRQACLSIKKETNPLEIRKKILSIVTVQ